MPPVIFLAVAGAAAYAGYKFLSKLAEQARTPPKSNGKQPKNLGGLEWDEAAGAYRPKKEV